MASNPWAPYWHEEPNGAGEWFAALSALAHYLRGPAGCPWDREQSALDFARYAQEEAAEMVEAFEEEDAANMAEEWGDTLFVLLASAAAAEAEGRFKIEQALRAAHEKMVRRHEHVFGESAAESPEEAIARWNAIKAREKESKDKA